LKEPIGVSILRPIKTISATACEPHLIDCLLSTVRQKYPLFELILTVASPNDLALPDIRRMIEENPDVDIKLIVGEEHIGINPKINNLIRGWRESKYDVVWVIDSNVWADAGALGRAMDVLTGQVYEDEYGKRTLRRPAKFVHHLPLCLDTLEGNAPSDSWTKAFGSKLEEMFLSSSHCKFYVAINTVAVAPCIVGKSNLFRKSHIVEVCPPTSVAPEGGLSSFKNGMCEDHLIGEKLWYTELADDVAYKSAHNTSTGYIKHALLNEMVFQPVCRMSLREYWDRRTRWLRVRKYTVLLATLVEPGTESFVCSLLGGLGFKYLNLLPAWLSLGYFWLISVTIWATTDYFLYQELHSNKSVNIDSNTPYWIRRVCAGPDNRPKRPLLSWLPQWIGRELLAFPIWVTAMTGGDVSWRGTKFTVSIAGAQSR